MSETSDSMPVVKTAGIAVLRGQTTSATTAMLALEIRGSSIIQPPGQVTCPTDPSYVSAQSLRDAWTGAHRCVLVAVVHPTVARVEVVTLLRPSRGPAATESLLAGFDGRLALVELPRWNWRPRLRWFNDAGNQLGEVDLAGPGSRRIANVRHADYR